MRRGVLAAALVAVLLSAVQPAPAQNAFAAGGSGSGSSGPGDAEPKPDNRPNIVLITTDDQTLADLRYMPRTRRLIGGEGVTFDGISPHPLCCPARAEILTGQFAQNNGVRSNVGRYGGYKRLRTRHTIATWLNRAGYHTMFLGKFLNGYGAKSDYGLMPGWDDWNPTVRGVYQYHQFSVRHNRRVRAYSGPYQTDFFTNLAVQKIRAAAEKPSPFLLWQSYVAPHVACPPKLETGKCWIPPMPAPRHRGWFADVKPPSMRSTTFNESDITDKPFPLVNADELTDERQARILLMHRRRLQALQSVDEGVARMIATLRRTGELRNTLIIFTSDNGYLLGEHRYVGKVLPYEPALQVPLLMRGPGVRQGIVRNRVATPIDLAPTITAVARARPTVTMDGRNLLPIANRSAPSWETLLIQAGRFLAHDDEYGWFYRGVRTDRYTYAYYPYADEHELYDRRRDPDQELNVSGDKRYKPVLRALRRRAELLGDCSGWSCRRTFKPLPAPLPKSSVESPTEPVSEPVTEPPTGPADTSNPPMTP
jgi:N-acetylglucosamine-6-sulfatase